jgi:hypothetical protein
VILCKVGDAMPLHVQLASGSTGKFPVAILRGESGSVLQTVSLVEAGDGLYINSTVPFPAGQRAVISTYKVYTDAGHTEESKEDGESVDILMLDSFAPQQRREELVAIFEASGLTAQIIGQELSGEVVEEILTGVVETNNMIGSIDGPQSITGVFER